MQIEALRQQRRLLLKRQVSQFPNSDRCVGWLTRVEQRIQHSRGWFRPYLYIALFVALSACEASETPSTVQRPEGPQRPQLVKGSFYGTEFSGQRTASGERFNPNALTAAHRTYPLGTILRVTNPANKKSVEVRINDRGPLTKDRDLDLSQHAAHRIGLKENGVMLLEVVVVKMGDTD